MDLLKVLNHEASYTTAQLQLLFGAWVVGSALDRRVRAASGDGHISDDDYRKQSIYSLFYSLYRSRGVVRSETGRPYELTFNTWGYDWPKALGNSPNAATDPQRFGKNAYAGLFEFAPVKDYIQKRDGAVHVVEMGCGTGAGAHHICQHVLPKCTYEAFDMQQAAINTCVRKFVPELGGRLVATRADCTALPRADATADIVAVCETHVTEKAGQVTPEDQAFFGTAHRLLKPGGFLVWGNAIPDSTWQPCFRYLESLGMRMVEERDVTKEAVLARDLDEGRVETYVEQCFDAFLAFRIPILGARKRAEAGAAMRNFYRNPRTKLYNNMTDGTDSYKVVAFQKVAESKRRSTKAAVEQQASV